MTAKVRVPRAQAEASAARAAQLLRPYVRRLEVAGSVRRRTDTCGDAELVVEPVWRYDMLGGRSGDDLTDYLREAVRTGRHGWALRPNVLGRPSGFGAWNKFLLLDGFPLDVFSAGERNWGMALFVRTGPAVWNEAAMSRFRQLGMAGHAYGGVTCGGQEVSCPQEEDVFRLLGWEYVEPWHRDEGTLALLRRDEGLARARPCPRPGCRGSFVRLAGSPPRCTLCGRAAAGVPA